MLHCGKFLLALAITIAIPGIAAAQATDGKPPQPEQALLKPEQLDALVAPIALYPDELLANVLAASTYPLEAVQADRWVKANKNLKGDALKAAVDKQAWDDSVKALAGTPDVLAMMGDKIDWTKGLGDAVLAQQPDVMDAIQRLRAKAQARNKLVTNKQQKVSVQRQENREVIVIEQAQSDTVYVPYYDPATVYGEWPYAEYPPYYFGYPSYIGAGVIAAGLAFGAGWAIGRWGNYWGGGCNWGNRNLYVNHFNKTNNIGNNWQHNPAHRQGVRYNNAGVQQKFGNNNLRAGAADRMDFRGRDGQKVLDAGKDRPGAGDRAGAAIALAPIGRGPVTAQPVIAPKEVTAPRQVMVPRLVIAPRAVMVRRLVIVPRAVIVPGQPTAAELPARATKAGAIRRSETYRRGRRPTFSLRAVGQVLPVRACRVQVCPAVVSAAAEAPPLLEADAAAVGLAAVAAAAAGVAVDAPISH